MSDFVMEDRPRCAAPEVELRMLAMDLRQFHDLCGHMVPNYKVQILNTATLVDVVADRIERNSK